MRFFTAVHADAGIRKKKNQDSVLVMEADSSGGKVLFAAVCDGMGGLARGETASEAMVNAFRNWFERMLPDLVPKMQAGSFPREELWRQWSSLIEKTSSCIEVFGRKHGISLGTTAAGLLLCGDSYYTLNVGDSRVYLLTDSIRQLTKDQTYVQQELDAGRMTYEESLTDPCRNVLLQCIGAGGSVRPVFGYGRAGAGQVYLLCSDGFRHVVPADELFRVFRPDEMTGEEIMRKRLLWMTEIIKKRRENDNISAALIRLL